jgi:dolichol-phosphate mannosyltransferase
MAKTLIFFATYNEAGNVGPLLTSISQYAADADILIVDDSSSDGTVAAAQELKLSNLTTLVRKGKLGLGTAHLLALAYAHHHRYDVVVTMDGDLSHDPSHLPALLNGIEKGADISIGSRYVAGGSCDYTGYRRNISKLGNVAARFLLNIDLHEFTTSYRAFRVSSLEKIDFSKLLVGGYSFFLTMVAEAARRGLRMTETPIHFRERGYGQSKIPAFEAIRGVANLIRLAFIKLLSKRTSPPTKFEPCPSCRTAFSLIANPFPPSREATTEGTCVFCGFHPQAMT